MFNRQCNKLFSRSLVSVVWAASVSMMCEAQQETSTGATYKIQDIWCNMYNLNRKIFHSKQGSSNGTSLQVLYVKGCP